LDPLPISDLFVLILFLVLGMSKRPLNSPNTNQLDKKLNLNVSSDLEISFSTQSFKSAVSFDSNSTLTETMAMTSVDLAIASSPEIIDLICTQVFEINGQPYLTPSLTDDDALDMLRQVHI